MRTIGVALVLLSACKFADLPPVNEDAGDDDGDAAVDTFAISTDPRAWVRIDGTTTMRITAVREGGFADAITVSVPDVPAGVQITGGTIAAGATETQLTVTATAAGGAVVGSLEAVQLHGTAGSLERTTTTQLLIAGLPGTFDDDFGTAGISLSGSGAATGSLRQSDGRIVVVTNDGDRGLRRFGVDGSPDSTFGAAGLLTPTFGDLFASGQVYPTAVGTSNGRLVVIASVDGDETATVRYDLFVKRYTADGQIDLTFPGRHVQFGTSVMVACATVGTDDVMFVGGSTLGGDAFVAKLSPDGTPDSSFGNGGLFVYDSAGNGPVVDVAMTEDGGVALLINDSNIARLVEVDGGGALRTSFGGGDGMVSLNELTPGSPLEIVPGVLTVEPGGTIVVGGRIYTGVNYASDAAMWRFQSNGELDAAFEQDGIWRLGTTDGNSVQGVVVTDTGYVAIGHTGDGAIGSVGLASYHLTASGAPTPQIPGAIVQTAIPFFVPSGDAYVRPDDRRIVLAGGGFMFPNPPTGVAQIWY